MDKLLKIKFEGEGISPNTVSSNEFAKIIAAYEDALNALMAKRHPSKSHMSFISVIDVQNTGETIIFDPNLESELISAADEINIAISTKSHNTLPFETVDNLGIIQKFVRERNCKASLNGYEGITSALITPETNLQIDESFYIYGETTIYGSLISIGGATPKAKIRMRSGKLLSVEIFMRKLGLKARRNGKKKIVK
jgi:hypothetical protein